MDSLRIGRSLRALRIRRGWRQADAAAAAGISRSQCSRIELGLLGGIPISDLQAACAALGADLDVRIRWHGEGLDRLLDSAHATLVNGVVRWLGDLGWACAVEVSFSRYGERGSIDVLAWHAMGATLLVVEVKSVVPDVQAMIAALDRKARLARAVGEERGWSPRVVGRLLVIGESATSRDRIRTHAELFGAAYPQRSVAVRRWLREPAGPLAGLLFLRNSQGAGSTRQITGRQRVRRRGEPPRPPD
jgi:transcriptional regulator with XRE-family HTH domain